MRAWPRFVRLLIAAWVIAAAPLSQLAAAEPLSPASASPLQFLRVYAPADRLKDWPLDKGHYPPIHRDEFERLVNAARADVRLPPASVGATLAAAQYKARLVDEELREGQAALEVSHASEAPVMLSLEPCQLPVSRASWTAAQRQPAKLGLAVDGKQQVLVERSGRLEFEWTLRGRRDAAGVISFAMELPACPMTCLILELPPQTAPVVERGIVSQEGAGKGGTIVWRIDMGGHHRFELRVVPTDEANRRRQMPVVRQSLIYDFSLHGVELSAQFKLDVPSEPLRQLTLALDSELQLITARYGELPLRWSVTAAGPKSQGTRVVLALPEPIRGMDRTLRLGAMAPLKTDRHWPLPRIRPEGTFWQEGNATLLVPAPLQVEQLTLRRARQTKAAPLAAGRPGESLELQYFAPEATVEVLLGQPQTPLQIDSGVSLELRRGEIAGKVVAVFRTSGGERFALEAGIGRQWIVDSVESLPAEAMDDWSVEGRDAETILKVRLAKALSPSRPVRLILSLRRLALGQPLRVSELIPLRLPAAPGARRLLALRAVEPCRLNLIAAERLTRLKYPDLSAAHRELFVEPPGDLLFESDDPMVASLQVSLETPRPDRSAAPRVETTSEAASTVSARTEPGSPLTAWVWDFQLESRYETDGAGRHNAVYRLENAGDRQLELTLPPATTLSQIQGIWVDQARVSWRLVGKESEGRLAIDLPTDARFPLVSVHFTTSGRRLRGIDRLLPPLPETKVPILVQHWTVWLPPGYEAVDADPRWQPRHAPAPTWSQRIFGPLGRSAEQQTFAPFHASAWSRMVQTDPASQSTDRKAMELLRHLGEQAARTATPGQSPALTWGTLLADKAVDLLLAESPGEAPTVALLIDRLALGQLGLGPRTPITASAAETPAVRGAAMLQQAGLVLLVHPEAIVLTSAADAALLRSSELTPTEDDVLWHVASGPLADHVQAALGEEGDAALVSVAVWQKSPGEPRGPWNGLPPSQFGAIDALGWTAYRLEVSGTTPVALAVMHRDTVGAFRWIVFLAVVAVGWWIRNLRPMTWIVLLASSASAALLLPEGRATAASGVFLGILGSWGFRLVFRRQRPTDAKAGVQDTARRATASGPDPSIGILAIAIAAWLCGSVAGEESSADRRPTAIPRVFIPVDDKQQPVGDKVYVPEAFYSQLQRRAAKGAEEPQGWMLTGGTYRGTLSWQGTPERLVLSELKASFDLQVFARATRVRLPLVREKANLTANGVLLDGRAVVPEWESDTGQLSLFVPEPGQRRLELSMQPTAQRSGATYGVDLRIPRLASSRVELAIPPDAPAIEIPSAAGSVVLSADPPRLMGDLGPADRLIVRWQEGARRGSTGPAVDAEELLWLKVQPGSVILDARLKLKIVHGRVSQFALVADPRLRLLPSQRNDSPVAQVHATPGQPQTIRIELSRAVSDQVAVELTFLLTGTSGVGNLRLPALGLLDARITKRWMAVSVDPALQGEQQTSGRMEAVGVPVFANAWGAAEVQPQFAYSLASSEPAWSMATRPCEPRTAADQTLALSLAEKEARVLFDARLTTTAGANFQYRIAAPSPLSVDSVSVTEAATERVARWSRDKDGSVYVFLSGPVTGKHDLSLRGRLPIPSQGPLALPTLRLEGTEVRSHMIQLFREPAVGVKISEIAGLTEVDPPPVDESKPQLGRLVKCWSVGETSPAASGPAADRKDPSAQLRCLPNRPKIDFQQITSLRSAGDAWDAQVDLRVRVSEGVVDELRFDVPPEWNGPYKVAPATTLKTIGPATGPGQRQLVVRPRLAIDGDYRVTISGPLTLPAGERVAAPEIVFRNATPGKRLLVLPTQSQLQPILWETRGLRECPLPKDFLAAPVARESFVAYQVQGEPFRAVLGVPERSGNTPQVYLADIRLAWQADGVCRGTAAFDLGPADLSQCLVRLPSGYRLVQVAVAASPAPTTLAGENQWQIALSPHGLPQRIEVLFTGVLSGITAAGPIEFDAPTLEGLPVRQTLWTVSGPPLYEADRPAAQSPVDRVQQELTRLQSVTAVIEQGADLPARPSEEILRWYRPMAHRWAAQYREVDRLLQTVHGDAAQNVRAELQAIDRKQTRIANRLGASQILSQEFAETSTADAPSQLWLLTLDEPQTVSRFTVTRGASTIALSYRPVETDRLSARLWGIAALLGASGLLAMVFGLDAIGAFFMRRPLLVGLVAGLCWWLWLEPSILGCAVSAVCLVGALRPLWQRRRRRHATIVPMGME